MTNEFIKTNAIGYDNNGEGIILKQFQDKTGWTVQNAQKIKPFKTLIQAVEYANELTNNKGE